jgi:murein DD-endopeptidase MepM/ murein hydrolase activator NlpD
MARIIRRQPVPGEPRVEPRGEPRREPRGEPRGEPIEPDAPSEVTPAGTIKTKMPDGARLNIGWDAITKYDAILKPEVDAVQWPIERTRGHIVIESQGNPKAVQKNNSNGWSYGLMQVVPYGVGWAGWHKLVKEIAGLPANASKENVVDALNDPKINIPVGVAILEGLYQQYGTLDKASSAFFLGNPYWDGADTVNGNTGDAYKRSLTGLITEQRGFTPAPDPEPTDLIAAVMGGQNYWIISEFAVWSGNGLYGYGVGHGLNGSQHTGIDIGADPGAPLYSPIDGVVVCAGTSLRAAGAHGSSCAAFNDYFGKGTGRVEVMTHDGQASLIFGHSSRSMVSIGQTVSVGDQVATVGGMNSWHCHLEARTWDNGHYMIRDAREVFAGGTGTVPHGQRLPMPQPDAWERGEEVTVLVDGVPLLQRANKNAVEVAPPFEAGDTFEAVQLAYSEDEDDWYWITNRATRIPIAGTKSRLLGER